MTVNVLGTEYEIIESDTGKDAALVGCDGYTDSTVKRIIINTPLEFTGSLKDLDEFRRTVLRHELVHAFLYESGLDNQSWGRNEEIVDWIALQANKLFKAFKSVEAI